MGFATGLVLLEEWIGALGIREWVQRGRRLLLADRKASLIAKPMVKIINTIRKVTAKPDMIWWLSDCVKAVGSMSTSGRFSRGGPIEVFLLFSHGSELITHRL